MENLSKSEEIFIVCMEECGELIQACSKMIRTKGKLKYILDLQDEIGDVVTMIEIMKEHGFCNEQQINKRMQEKKEKLKKWSNIYD